MSGGCIFKNTGASRHWHFQRISAFALIPLLLWFLSIVPQIFTASHGEVSEILSGSWLLLSFIALMLMHGSLGMEVIYEDYIPNIKLRRAMIMGTNILAGIAVITIGIFG